MLPPVGTSKPPIIRRVVVLPHPDGPRREKNSPSSTVNDRSSTATVSLKTLETFSSRTDDMFWLPRRRTVLRLMTHVLSIGVPPGFCVHLRVNVHMLRRAKVVEPLGPELSAAARPFEPSERCCFIVRQRIV